MNLSSYIQRTRALGRIDVSTSEIDAISERLDSGVPSLETILPFQNEKLTPYVLLVIWRAYQMHQVQQSYLKEVIARRHRDGLAPIPSTLLQHSLTRHEVSVIERADAMAPSGTVPEHRRRDAIKAAVSLWYACLSVMRNRAALTVRLLTNTSRLAGRFEQYAGTRTLSEISNEDWLPIRRGERLGILELNFECPDEELRAQVESRAANLSAIAGGRDSEALLDILVMVDLEQWSLSLKDQTAETISIRNATHQYMNLLAAQAPDLPIVAAVSVPPSGPLGVAIVLRDGRLVGQGEIGLEEGLRAALESIVGRHPVEALVIPSEAMRKGVTDTLRDAFTNIEKLTVTTRGLKEARARITDDVERPVKDALALARRVLLPFEEWQAINPLALGLADHQHELDEIRLSEAYTDVLVLARRGLGLKDMMPKSKAAPSSSRAVAKPLVKSLEDIKPGMELSGTVSRLASFGAFINLGLSSEGLVHVSEISEHFIDDPKQALKVGQTVKAQVLGIDLGRQRISLTLRKNRKIDQASAPAPKPRTSEALSELIGNHPSRNTRHEEGAASNRGTSSVSRAQALADLESLFRKK